MAIALDAAGNSYVTDPGNNRVQVLSPTGQYLREFGPLDDPRGLAIDGAGNIYVGESGRGRIVKLSPTGVLLATWGTPGNAPGQIVLPAGIAVDAGGNVYVAEGDPENGSLCNCRVQKFSPTGQVLTVWR